MRRSIQFALRVTALSMAIASCSIASAFGQYVKWLGDSYGTGAAGTIGRGTYILPWGPSDPRSSGRPIGPAFYGRGDSSVPVRNSTQVTSRPYLTNQHYEPGDGYRYPLYYNPATRTYFYYPVRR